MGHSYCCWRCTKSTVDYDYYDQQYCFVCLLMLNKVSAHEATKVAEKTEPDADGLSDQSIKNEDEKSKLFIYFFYIIT